MLIGALVALALSPLIAVWPALDPLIGRWGLSSEPGGLVFRLDDSTDLTRVDGSWYVVNYGQHKHALRPSTNGGYAIQVGPLLLWPRAHRRSLPGRQGEDGWVLWLRHPGVLRGAVGPPL